MLKSSTKSSGQTIFIDKENYDFCISRMAKLFLRTLKLADVIRARRLTFYVHLIRMKSNDRLTHKINSFLYSKNIRPTCF